MDQPAILGGSPVFEQKLGIVSPKLPSLEKVADRLAEALRTGSLTNNGAHVQLLEKALEQRLQVPHAVTVSNATLGLILALEAVKKEPEGEVILPAFTYCASAHALYWARLKPVFVDILSDTYTVDPAAVESAITPRTQAIMGVHIYGHPCEIDPLEEIAERHGIPLLFDAAHAIGSTYHGKVIGQFGAAEVFSFHATKVFPVGEGGCISTSNDSIAQYIHLARKFGDPGNEETLFAGMNAKMQEFNAILGSEALEVLDQHIQNRLKYAGYLVERLGRLPGITFQTIRADVTTNYQNFSILVDEKKFGVNRDQLYEALLAENIMSRRYFYPPLHKHPAYSAYQDVSLPCTERISSQVLCLPFYSIMSEQDLDRLCYAIERIHRYSHDF